MRCEKCLGIMLLPFYYLKPDLEEGRYRLHNNDIHDSRYQAFVSPLTTAVKRDFSPDAVGLDYGCGPGPVAAVELEKQGFTVRLYDPFFENHQENLQQQYNFIICCEVMEHFHQPAKEFRLLSDLLRPGGKLYCKTSLFTEDLNFPEWYYKNDPTHVFFYAKESLEWIRNNLGFRNLTIEPKLIVLEK